MELVENFRACFFNVVIVKGTPEAATTTQGKTRTSNPDLSYPILSRPSHYTTTLTQADKGGGKYFVNRLEPHENPWSIVFNNILKTKKRLSRLQKQKV